MLETQDGTTTGTGIPAWVTVIAALAAAAGLLGTASALASGRPEAWWMLLVNFLFFTGIAQGVLMWSAIFRTAQCAWAPAVSRLGRSTVWFLLLFSLAVFVVLTAGREHWLTWLHHDVGHKAVWLNEPFFFFRDRAALIVMAVRSAWFVWWYGKADVAPYAERDRWHARLNRLAVTLVISYCFLYSLLAFDLVMSLEPEWFSSLFGAYFFVGNQYLSMAVLILMGAAFRGAAGWGHLMGPRQFRDMGNLMMGFALLTTGFFFAQYLTIWYGNLPEETTFFIKRVYSPVWRVQSIAVLVAAYLGPFFLLMWPKLKTEPRRLVPIAALVVVGMWTERWLMVIPTLSPERVAGLGPQEWAIPLGFLGVFLLFVTASVRRPEVSPLDTALELSEGVAL